MYEDILKDILALLGSLNLYSTVNVGSLPSDNGISMYIGPGSPDEIYLDKASRNSFSLVINAKHSNQLTCLGALDNIHSYLTKLKDYPVGDGYQILNILTTTSPNYISKEDSGQWIFGSILEVQFYIEGVE